jgi:hypothetical protein
MGLLLDWIVDEVFTALIRGIHRATGWVGCLIATIVVTASLSLLIWLIVRWAQS